MVQLVEVVCQFFRTVEIVDVDIRLMRGSIGVILRTGAHNDGDHVMTEMQKKMLNSAKRKEEGPFQFWIIMIMLSATLNSSPKWKWGKVLTRTKRNEFVRAFQFFAEKRSNAQKE